MHSPVATDDIWNQDSVAAVEAYRALRRALILTDGMSLRALRILATRAYEASHRYSVELSQPTDALPAMNEVLDTYSRFVAAVILEKIEAGRPAPQYAQMANVSRSVMSRHILDLSIRQRSGEPGLDLLHTRANPTNLRMHEVYLTGKGRHMLHEVSNAWRLAK